MSAGHPLSPWVPPLARSVMIVDSQFTLMRYIHCRAMCILFGVWLGAVVNLLNPNQPERLGAGLLAPILNQILGLTAASASPTAPARSGAPAAPSGSGP